MTARWAVFCEARGDFRAASGLVERVLREHSADWLRDLLDSFPEAVRVWVGPGDETPFFDTHRTYREALRRGIRLRYGFFDGAPAAPGALALYTAAQLVSSLRAKGAPDGPWALVYVWDADRQGALRREGLDQARREAKALLGDGALAVGVADPNREAWVLAGFVPEGPEEQRRLDELRQRLGFWPNETPERLTAQDEHAKGHTKPVLRALVGDDPAREARCWTDAPFDNLLRRGAGCGLAAFLGEVGQELLPQVDPSARVSPKG